MPLFSTKASEIYFVNLRETDRKTHLKALLYVSLYLQPYVMLCLYKMVKHNFENDYSIDNL